MGVAVGVHVGVPVGVCVGVGVAVGVSVGVFVGVNVGVGGGGVKVGVLVGVPVGVSVGVFVGVAVGGGKVQGGAEPVGRIVTALSAQKAPLESVQDIVTLGVVPDLTLPPPNAFCEFAPPVVPAFQSGVCPGPAVRPPASPRAATLSKRYCPSVVGQATDASVVFPCALAAE